MTDRNAILEALASILEDYRCGRDGKTAKEAAAAVLELVGPRELVWVGVSTYGGKAYDATGFNRAYRIVPKDGGEAYLFNHECGGFFPTLESAQAAAQKHADAAHWANCPLGKLAGVV